MAKARLKFTRTGTFVETGECVVDVDHPSMGEIHRAAYAKDFREFLTRSRLYEDEAWSFELIEIENDKRSA